MTDYDTLVEAGGRAAWDEMQRRAVKVYDVEIPVPYDEAPGFIRAKYPLIARAVLDAAGVPELLTRLEEARHIIDTLHCMDPLKHGAGEGHGRVGEEGYCWACAFLKAGTEGGAE